MRTRTVSPEVLYPAESPVVVAAADVADWVARSRATPRQRIRLCTHPDPAAAIHEMLIVHARDTYVRPHQHLGKPESFHLIDGALDVVLFDEAGAVWRVIPMTPYAAGGTFYYRLDEPRYHTVVIRSPMAVFHEVTAGPFCREDTIFAPWSPAETESVAVAVFQQHLNQQLRRAATHPAPTGPTL